MAGGDRRELGGDGAGVEQLVGPARSLVEGSQHGVMGIAERGRCVTGRAARHGKLPRRRRGDEREYSRYGPQYSKGFSSLALVDAWCRKIYLRLGRPDRATGCQQGPSVELVMTVFSRRSIFASALLAGLLPSTALLAADKPKEIRVDWATYNPVSMLLKDKGFLEKEFAKDGIAIRWVKTVSSSNALAIPQCRLDRLRLDRGLGRAGRQDQRQPDQVGLRLFASRMDRAGDHQGQQDQQARGPQGQEGRDGARHRSAHLPGAHAACRSASPTRTSRRCWCSSMRMEATC